MTTWLMAYDFSPPAERALRTAVELLGRKGGGRLVVVHVHQHGSTANGEGVDLATLGSSSELDRAYFESAQRDLERVVAAAAVPGVTLEPRVLWGWPSPTICELADTLQPELLIVGSHGRRGFKRFVLGSVAEAIVRKAPCSVLVVKHPE